MREKEVFAPSSVMSRERKSFAAKQGHVRTSVSGFFEPVSHWFLHGLSLALLT